MTFPISISYEHRCYLWYTQITAHQLASDLSSPEYWTLGYNYNNLPSLLYSIYDKLYRLTTEQSMYNHSLALPSAHVPWSRLQRSPGHSPCST